MALKKHQKRKLSYDQLSLSIVSPFKKQLQKGGDPLNTNSLETTDIFRGAFYLCMGGDLADIRVNKRQIASFIFAGPDLIKHDKAYIKGQALVNPVQFRQALNHLRNCK